MNASLNVYAVKKKTNDSPYLPAPHIEQKANYLCNLHLAWTRINQAIMRIDNQEALFREICKIAVEQGRLQMAWIGLVNKGTQTIAPTASYGCDSHLLKQITISIALNKLEDYEPIAVAMHNNQPVICNDFFRSPQMAAWRNTAPTTGFRSAACFPFQSTKCVSGILNLYTLEKNFFDDTVTHLIEQMTRDISFALSNTKRNGIAVPFINITRPKQNHVIPQENTLRYWQLIELLPETIFICQGGKFVLLNQAAAHALGAHSVNELINRDALDFIHPDCRHKFEIAQKALLSDVNAIPFEEQVWKRADGTHFHAEVAATRLMFDGSPAMQVVVRDISERKRAEQMQAGQNHILNMIANRSDLSKILREITLFMEMHTSRSLCSIMLLDARNNLLCDGASPNLPQDYVRAIGLIPVGASGGSNGTAASRAEPVITTDIVYDPIWAQHREVALKHGLRACSSWPIISKDRMVLGTVSLYFKDIAHPTARDMELFDICSKLAAVAIESHQMEERIRRLAHYDGLTSLPNRFLFTEFLDQALRKAHRCSKRFAIFFLDLDKFKEVNDTYGHDVGDAVLKEIATRLRGSLRQTDKIARMGGDEFYVLIEDLQDGIDAAEIAEKLLEEASRPIRIGKHEYALGVSIGIALYPYDGATAQALLRNADYAMYQAKKQNKNGYCFFSSPRSQL